MCDNNSEVGETGSTSDPGSTNLPTYFSYRVTVGHEFVDDVASICRKYSNDWCMVLHNPDADDHNPHYHIIFCDWRLPGVDPAKKVANLQKAFKDRFNGKGNQFHAGKWMSNDPEQALQYFSHDPVRYLHMPASWSDRIKAAPAWVPKNGSSSGPSNSRRRERLGDPVLTLSNCIKQAVIYRHNHQMDTYSLQNVLSRMVCQSGWTISRDIESNGIPRTFHDIFRHRCGGRKPDLICFAPHDKSAKKLEWADRPDTSGRCIYDPVGGGSMRITPEDNKLSYDERCGEF